MGLRSVAILLGLLVGTSAPAFAVVSGAEFSAGDERLAQPVVLLSLDGNRCTATHVAPGRILTAGHCLTELPHPDTVGSPFGPTLCISNAQGKDLGCANVFDVRRSTLEALDLAVIELRPGKLRDRLEELDTVEISFDPVPDEGGPTLEIAGQGCAKYWPGFFEGTGSGKLRHGVVRRTGVFGWFYQLQWAPGKAGAGACQGDSGGPLYSVSASGHMVQHGVAHAIVLPKDGSKSNPLPVESRYVRMDFSYVRSWLAPML